MKCNICINKKSNLCFEDCFSNLLEDIKIHYNEFRRKNEANERKLQALQELNLDYKKQLDILTKKNDKLNILVENTNSNKRRKTTSSINIEDDEDALTDSDLNNAAHSQNIFEDSSIHVSAKEKSSKENSISKESPAKVDNWNIFKNTPKKLSPDNSSATIFQALLNPESPDSRPRKVLALYSPKSKKILPSPLKNLPKRQIFKPETKSKTSANSNLQSSMSFISRSNKENKSLIQSRLVFPKVEGNSLVLDSAEETFCDEIQPSQKSPKQSKRMKKSISVAKSSNYFQNIDNSKQNKVSCTEKTPVKIKEEPADDLEVIDDDNCSIKSMDLLAELMNQEGTENLHYIKSINEAAAKKIQKQNEAKVRSLSINPSNRSPTDPVLSSSTPKPKAYLNKSVINPLRNVLTKIKQEPQSQNLNSSEELWDKFENEISFDANKVTEHKVKKTKQRTYKDCPDCLQFIKDYGSELSEAVIQNRIEKCTRHNRMENDMNITPEGFWDPFMQSLSPGDPRNEILKHNP